MRPMIMDFTADKNVRNLGDQYMFGPAFLVAPVYEYGARTRKVYLPESTQWYDFYSGSAVASGSQTVDAPYERIPLFVRAGAIVPFGPDIQWSDEKPADNITLYVYAGANGKFSLYEDEGTNYNYEKGQCATIDFTYDDATSKLTISERKGEFNGMLKQRTFNVVKVSKDKAVPYNKNTKGIVVNYDGKAQTVNL
jgi:alpha-D-xyloside xylohydrolase